MTTWTLEAIEKKGLKVRDTVRVIATPAEVVRLELPLPPSINHAWQNVPGKGRVRSPEYRRWHKLAFDELTLQRPGKITGRFCVVISLGRIKRRADVDNRAKPVLDLMSGVVTDDDAACERLSIGWADDVPAERITVEVRKAA
jgi:Holliday junction resolvase RusA-like endonuclease